MKTLCKAEEKANAGEKKRKKEMQESERSLQICVVDSIFDPQQIGLHLRI